MKRLIVLLLSAAALAAGAADYDYAVEYVKSTHDSVVRTDFRAELGVTFRIDLRLEGPYNQMFGGKFDHAKNTTALFGSVDPEDPAAKGFYNQFRLEIGGNDAQTHQAFMSLGRKGPGPWEHCGTQDLNDSIIGGRVPITYDGRNVQWGSFRCKLNGERKKAVAQPVAFFGYTDGDGSVRSFACYDMSLYGATFYRDGKVLADFIPVVKGGVAGLYEKVGGKFFASVTDAPLTAGPKKDEAAPEKAAGAATTKNGRVDFSIPVFEDDFSSQKVFAERWNFLGEAQKSIVMKGDGTVRFEGRNGDGISWKGELPDEFAAEGVVVLYPEWSAKKCDPKDENYHWVCMGCDYGGFGMRSDGYGVYLYVLPPPADQTTKGAYPLVANYRSGEPVTIRFERRKIGESMAAYTYYVNGVQLGYYTAPAPKKVVGFDGVARYKPLNVDCFDCPFELRRVTVYALKGEKSANLIANSGFEFDNDGVPPGYCNRNYCDMGRATVADYTEKYLRCFMTDKSEKHSGAQSLKLALGPFVRSFEFFSWNAPTEKGKSAVLSVWAKASEPDVQFLLRLADERKTVKLTTDWARYEITTTNMPSPGIFSPVWFDVPELWKRTTEAAIWLDDIQLEIVDPPAGGFDPAKTYATEYRPKAGDAENYALGKPLPHAKPARTAPLSAAENALNGYALPAEGLVLGHYDFYMSEPRAGFRVWDGKGGFEETSVDIAALAAGTHEVTVKAFGRDWKASVRKLPYAKGATQVNQWSRSLVHDGEPVFMSAPCLIGRENAPKEDGTSTQIDVLSAAGFRFLNLQNHLNVRDIEGNARILRYARGKGMKFMIWSGEGELRDVGDIMTWENKPTDWSRQKMYDILDSEDVITHLVLDEPEYRKAADCQAYMKREKARFPHKPVQMNNCWLGINGRFAGLPTDILMIDFYLTCEGTTVDMVVSKVDVLRSIAPGKPCWYFMDGENSLHYRIPSFREQIAQSWGSVAAGASGLSWFVNMPTSRCNFDAMVQLNREFLDNRDFLCSDELCGGAVSSETTDYIRCLTRRHGDEWRIYAVNVNPHPNARVEFRLPADIPQDAKIEVLYENRALEAKKGAFGDAFDGFARHVYRIVK